MKKIKLLFITLFISLFITLPVYADGTSTYYIEADIQSNGDMNVKELKILDGQYNGISTKLRFKNDNIRTFTGVLDDFEGSTIYNASGIEDIKVYDVKKSTTDFSLINSKNTEFTQVSYANKGDFGKYTKEDTNSGANLLIYMPSSYNRASLVTYTLKDVVVIHNDVAEIAWDFISKDYEEDIYNLKIVVNLPTASNELRVFSHGPLNGENEIVSKSKVQLVYDKLYMGNAVDMRVVFDKDIIKEGTKYSNIDGLENILTVEKKRADKANAIREEARKEENFKNMIINIIKGLFIVWFIGLIIIVYKIYTKYDKEYKAEFDGKYYREFPSTYGPEIVSYLMYKNINKESFGATVLELIRKKALTIEEVVTKSKILKKEKKDYKLIKNEKPSEDVTDTENIILKLLIDTIGNGKEVTLNEVTDYSKNYSSAKTFMNEYNSWKNKSEANAIRENFYENTTGAKAKGILYSLIIPAISFLTIWLNLSLDIFYLLSIVSIIAIIYFIRITKRTVKGNEDYAKWNGLKNFLLDFGKFDDKEIPEIKLWEKYLVYATVFGIADKVQEQMKIKLTDFNYDDRDFTFMRMNNWYFYHSINNTLNNSISTARNTITSHEISSSSNSSSGGFGGGSSFGGGGFGGGGSGGGRF